MTEKEPRKSRIPEFASREEEAEFWDTHDLTDYWDEFKPVQVSVAKKLSARITIDLDSEGTGKNCALWPAKRASVPLPWPRRGSWSA
jgi:CopG antitoxin of type II toxin-antitoxin system